LLAIAAAHFNSGTVLLPTTSEHHTTVADTEHGKALVVNFPLWQKIIHTQLIQLMH
jgi:hypothetical protein